MVEGLGGGLSVQADQRPDEQPQALGLFLGTLDIVGAARAAGHQELLQVGEVGSGELEVALQASEGGVVVVLQRAMSTQER